MREAQQPHFVFDDRIAKGECFVMAVESGRVELTGEFASELSENASHNAYVTLNLFERGYSEDDIRRAAFARSPFIYLLWPDPESPYGFSVRLAKGIEEMILGQALTPEREFGFTCLAVSDERTADLMAAEFGDARLFKVAFDPDVEGAMDRALKLANKRARKHIRDRLQRFRRRKH